MVLIILFLVLVFLRDIYKLVVIGQFSLLKSTRKVDSSEANKFLILLAIGPDDDILEVWTILLRYLSKNPPLLGKSLIRIPFTLTSSNFRLNTGLKTGVDLLNEYYDFKTYQYRKYGFNLNAAQEMVLNFSCPEVLFGFVSGLVSGLLTKWYYKKLITKDFFKPTVYFSALSSFIGTFSAFQWMVFQLVFAEVICLLSKIRLRKSYKELSAGKSSLFV